MTAIEKISRRDCMNPVRVANKINEIIEFLQENEVLTKAEYEKLTGKKGYGG